MTHPRAPANTASQLKGTDKLTYAFALASKIYLLNFFITAVVLTCVFVKHNFSSVNKIENIVLSVTPGLFPQLQ